MSTADTDPDAPLAVASWNAVAIASVSWQQSVNALRHILGLARDHGLTRDELAAASGLSTAFIDELLEQVD